jgi:hypothetical protein
VDPSLHEEEEEEEEDRSFNEAARELEQLQMAFAVLASRPAAGNQEHGADTTDEPDLTSTLRGSNPQETIGWQPLTQMKMSKTLTMRPQSTLIQDLV